MVSAENERLPVVSVLASFLQEKIKKDEKKRKINSDFNNIYFYFLTPITQMNIEDFLFVLTCVIRVLFIFCKDNFI